MVGRLTAVAAAACMMAATGAWAQNKIVPIEEEPMHKLKFENAHVRFFDVQLPPGYESLWHSHVFDGVFVNISPSETTAQDLGGEPTKRDPRIIGADQLHRLRQEAEGAPRHQLRCDGLSRDGCGDSQRVRRFWKSNGWRRANADPGERPRARDAHHDRAGRDHRAASALRHAGRSERGPLDLSGFRPGRKNHSPSRRLQSGANPMPRRSTSTPGMGCFMRWILW